MAEQKSTTAKKPVAKPVVKKAIKREKFIAKFAPLWHPDQKVWIREEPVELKLDSWTVCQAAAGLLVKHEA